MSSRTFNRVVVLKGGRSAERDVSLVSGTACAKALRLAGYQVEEIDAAENVAAELAAISPDVVFNALHGRWGEDGCIQGLLEWLGIAYTHSGVLASALAMDKSRTKAVYAAHDLPIAPGMLAARAQIEARHPMNPPYVVKPNNDGSSVGIHLVMDETCQPVRLEPDAPDFLLVEQYVPGRELTVTVMDDRPLAVTDIRTEGWYDYRAKYTPGCSNHQVPAEIPDEISQACLAHACTAHKALGCRGISRTDFRWNEDAGMAGLVLLETNTQPGMTPTSLAPEQAAHCGISFGELCIWLIEDASCHR